MKTQRFFPCEHVRMTFLSERIVPLTCFFGPSMLSLWMAIPRTCARICPIFLCDLLTCGILLLSASLPRVVGDVMQRLLLGFPESNSVWTALLDHVIWERQSVESMSIQLSTWIRITQAISTSAIHHAFWLIGKTIRARSIPHSPNRRSFSSNSHWMDGRRSSASNLLVMHLGEDVFSIWHINFWSHHVLLLPLTSVAILGSWNRFFVNEHLFPRQRVSSCQFYKISCNGFLRARKLAFFLVYLDWIGAAVACCRIMFPTFCHFLFRVVVDAWRDVSYTVSENTSFVFIEWWESVVENDRV